jgi:signal transduction histidine kinase
MVDSFTRETSADPFSRMPESGVQRVAGARVLGAPTDSPQEAVLVVLGEDLVVSRDPRFAKLTGVPEDILASGSLSKIVRSLRDHGDEIASQVARLFVAEDPPESGELVLEAGRTLAWSVVPIAHDGREGRVWTLRDVRHVRAEARALSDAEKWSRTFAAHAVRGSRRIFSASAVLPCDADGKSRKSHRVTVVIRDITEQARMHTQLAQKERLATVGLLAAGVAHEINNPLSWMLLNLQRLEREIGELAARRAGETDELADAVHMTFEGARRIRQIVQDLRCFSRSDHDDVCFAIDVRRVLTFTLDMAGAELRRRARVVRDFGDVPPVKANEALLTQVFLNLVLNAAQAISDGSGHENHEIRIVTSTDERGHAVVEVCDSGSGIPAHVLRNIFDPFFTTKAPGAGTGLGLAICHGITTSLGGEISAESVEGRGSVFRVVLPAAADA